MSKLDKPFKSRLIDPSTYLLLVGMEKDKLYTFIAELLNDFY